MVTVTLPFVGEKSGRFDSARIHNETRSIELLFDVDGAGPIPVRLDVATAILIRDKIDKGIKVLT